MDLASYWRKILDNPFWIPKAQFNDTMTLDILLNPLFHSIDAILFELGWYYILHVNDQRTAYRYWAQGKSWKCIEAIATYILQNPVTRCQFYIKSLVLLESEITELPMLITCFKQIQETLKQIYNSMEFEEQGELIRFYDSPEILEKYMYIDVDADPFED